MGLGTVWGRKETLISIENHVYVIGDSECRSYSGAAYTRAWAPLREIPSMTVYPNQPNRSEHLPISIIQNFNKNGPLNNLRSRRHFAIRDPAHLLGSVRASKISNYEHFLAVFWPCRFISLQRTSVTLG
jgi:hypothetical protein